jgi:ATP-dependent DNA helicase RecG
LLGGLVGGLVESQKQILKLIEENPKISKREMAEQIGISSTAIDKNLKTLKSKQIIRRAGNDKTGYWL